MSKLLFDSRNPRLVEFREITSGTTERKIIRLLWETMDVEELILSIAGSGYYRNEPLMVAEESGKNIVIEGNRRLAAVKIILNPGLVKAALPPVDPAIRESLHELPVIITTRRKSWRYVGFKHINGPAKWNSYAKARYIAQVHDEFAVPLTQIASQIGDTHKTVQRLYRGLMVIEPIPAPSSNK
ncbi:MAG: hypothetical protein GY765_07985 [bacterium]|nr:hypothetical protein [bacterium]